MPAIFFKKWDSEDKLAAVLLLHWWVRSNHNFYQQIKNKVIRDRWFYD